MSTESLQLGSFFDQLQMVVGMLQLEPAKGLSALTPLVEALPETLTGARSTVVLAQLAAVLARVAQEADPGVRELITDHTRTALNLSMRYGEWKQHLRDGVDVLRKAGASGSISCSSFCPRDLAILLQIIDEQYTRSTLTLSELSRRLDRSLGHLSRMMHRYLGHGFRAYLRLRRIEAAEDMLRRTSLTLKQVAEAAGFSNASQFSRQYKAVRGVPPSAVRHVNRGYQKTTSSSNN
jgi:AraC-like DNA-binding protein